MMKYVTETKILPAKKKLKRWNKYEKNYLAGIELSTLKCVFQL